MNGSAESRFLDAEGQRILVDCAVLYLDLLGVSAMASGGAAQKELRRFERTLKSAFRFELGTMGSGDDSVIAAVFSDSFVAAAPIQEGFADPSSEAIANLVFEAATIQGTLALNNYFARGAITIGKCHFHHGLIFGPALVEAVRLEQTTARDPRIILSPEAIEALRHGRKESISREPILVDEDGLAIVDYLTLLSEDPMVTARRNLGRHRRTVTENLARHANEIERWRKYRWVAEYHNEFVRQRQGELLESRVDPATLMVDVITRERKFHRVRARG